LFRLSFGSYWKLIVVFQISSRMLPWHAGDTHALGFLPAMVARCLVSLTSCELVVCLLQL